MTTSDEYEVIPLGYTKQLLREIAVHVSAHDLPEYTPKAKRYMWAHWLWRWAMPKARAEYERCSLERQIELLSRTLDAGNAILEQDNGNGVDD